MGVVHSQTVSEELLRMVLLDLRPTDLFSCKLVSKCLHGDYGHDDDGCDHRSVVAFRIVWTIGCPCAT